MLGSPGVGETHLAVDLGLKAIRAGYRHFASLAQTTRAVLVAEHEPRDNRGSRCAQHSMWCSACQGIAGIQRSI
ncbi:ATP-binding protein [Steroidobacter sp. S1-65]|uniref:ATP-binding protein n=1 Tax=Steroidobacter gossypii TaxID=2805490 RepID=A0ABS1WZT2_9GAMM|nr:ATP-binding protein [Steroidobacter gossypii]